MNMIWMELILIMKKTSQEGIKLNKKRMLDNSVTPVGLAGKTTDELTEACSALPECVGYPALSLDVTRRLPQPTR